MTSAEYPDAQPGRPLWLITLADLALLLVGFFVLLQATQQTGARALGPKALAAGMREGFGGAALRTPTTATPAPALPVAAAGMLDFAVGSAAMPGSPDALLAWAREAAQDPRVQLTVTGSVDGSAADVDPATGSAAILAYDRARTVAVALARMTPTSTTRRPIALAAPPRPGRRAAMVTLAFAGEPPRTR